MATLKRTTIVVVCIGRDEPIVDKVPYLWDNNKEKTRTIREH